MNSLELLINNNDFEKNFNKRVSYSTNNNFDIYFNKQSVSNKKTSNDEYKPKSKENNLKESSDDKIYSEDDSNDNYTDKADGFEKLEDAKDELNENYSEEDIKDKISEIKEKISENPEIQAEIMSIFANILNIPQEELIQKLSGFNIKAEDLIHNNKIIEFLNLNFNTSSPEELLQLPEIANILNEIKFNLENMYKENSQLNNIISNDKNVLDLLKNTLPKDNLSNEQTSELTKIINNLELEKPIINKEKPTEIVQNKDIKEVAFSEKNIFDNNEHDTAGKDNNNENRPSLKSKENNEKISLENNEKISNVFKSYESTLFDDLEINGNSNIRVLNNDKSNFKLGNSNNLAKQNINPKEIINQFNEKFKFSFKQGMTEVRVRLSPENLGDISLKISTLNSIVKAHFIAESQKVKEIIEANLDSLKDTLSEQGIKVEEFSVSVDQDDNNDNSALDQFLKERQNSSLRANKIATQIMSEKEVEVTVDNSEFNDSNINYVI